MGLPPDERESPGMASSSYDDDNAVVAPRKASTNPHNQRDFSDRQRGASGDSESRQRSHARERRPSGQRMCGKCQRHLTGQFVRALGDTFHLDCFTCHDCDKVVASKFFPVPDQPPNQYPLCETDYFRRLELLCHACGGALRGSYITALDRKYHIEHFTCSVCPTVFGAQDSYYEHEGNVYCHYHYSTEFAQKCNGCQTAILKQFVEIFRKGVNQHWHPECYMIHKYWNVRLHAPQPRDGGADESELVRIRQEREATAGEASEEQRTLVRKQEEAVEFKVHWIWQTLSTFEERSATCISDMLLHVSNGAYMDGVVAARKFITHVDLLFKAADDLDRRLQTRLGGEAERNTRAVEHAVHPGLSYNREAKLLCKKVIAFFQLLAESQETGVRRLGVTQELLSLVTGLAHYLKLMIRICLSGSLKLERETSSAEGLESFLSDISKLDDRLELEAGRDSKADAERYVDRDADSCAICSKAVEDRCFRIDARVIHVQCMACSQCGKLLADDADDARWTEQQRTISCPVHAPSEARVGGFAPVTRLQQYVHLLRVAHARLLATLITSGALPHTSDDPNLSGYVSKGGLAPTIDGRPAAFGAGSRSRSFGGRSGSTKAQGESNYQDTVGDIRRLRSTRMDKHLSNAGRQARQSRIIGGPEGMRPSSSDGAESGGNKRKTGTFQIIQDADSNGEQMSQLTFGGQDSMTLDDIPRLVQAQQTREQRPNASKYARQPMVPQEPQPRLINGHTREFSGEGSKRADRPAGAKKYFSELTALEHFIVRHVAVLSLEPLLSSQPHLVGQFNQEELLDLIETKRPTFWSKFGKAFQPKEKRAKGGAKTGMFGVPLEQLLERDWEESTDGVGPGSLKIPSLIQEAVSAMKTMDMSVEGVFRKNGNIKRLNEASADIDAKGMAEVDLMKENPVQVAALLKKYLREMPDPLLTLKLNKLWLASNDIVDEETRLRVLHLTCCLLPKVHRDTVEVLFTFMNWVSSFSHVDEESGSKMDVHNLATVIAPNIINRGKDAMPIEDNFRAIETVHTLIQCNESLCEVPEDLALILNDSSLFSNSADITTKEILKRYGDRTRVPIVASPAVNSAKLDSYGTTPGSSTSAQQQQSPPGLARGNKPMAHRVDTDPEMQSAWQNESSVRHVGSDLAGAGAVHTAVSTPGSFGPPNGGGASSGGPYSGAASPLATPTLPYAHPRRQSGDASSRGSESPSRGSMRGNTYGDKQRAMSVGVQ